MMKVPLNSFPHSLVFSTNFLKSRHSESSLKFGQFKKLATVTQSITSSANSGILHVKSVFDLGTEKVN